MSDPTEVTKDNPHPISSHRTPGEIAKDEAGPAAPKPAEPGPVSPAGEQENEARRAAVQRAAHAPDEHAANATTVSKGE